MAIKRLRDDLRESPEDMKEIRDRFEREARLLDDTLDHENIVPVLMRNLSGPTPTERGSSTGISSRRTLSCLTGRSALATWDLARTSSAGRYRALYVA
jgi:hypothetical protein